MWLKPMVAAWGLILASCASPLSQTPQNKLREQLVASNRAYLAALADGPTIEISRDPSEVERELSEDRRQQLDRMSGPISYEKNDINLGKNLLGEEDRPTVAISLRQAIHLAVKNNLDVKQARMLPAVGQAQVTQALAAFDAIFFVNYDFQKLDSPQPPTQVGFDRFSSRKSDSRTYTAGVRKQLSSGGQFTLSTRYARNFSSNTIFTVNTNREADISLALDQPLLRNFGADVNRAQISLTQNARRESVEDLRRQVIETIANTEQAYWNLVFARQRLLISHRLLDRTKDDRDQLKQREDFDVSPVRLTEANSFVEIRRADVIRARQQVRLASDALKRLINSPDLPVAGEELILPVETPADLPVEFSLLDSVTTALQNRPEARRALLLIKDASIRQRVADNQRLPLLNLSATVRYNGVTTRRGEDISDVYDNLDEWDFIDYLLSLQFEVPIGNRGPEAAYLEQQLTRRAAVINYQNIAQQVVLDVKDTLRNLLTAHELIGAARAARRAAADNLRAIEEQEEAGVALTPEFLLDLKLSTQQRLADSEIDEIQALTDYNASIARFYQAMGTLLDRNGITFRD